MTNKKKDPFGGKKSEYDTLVNTVYKKTFAKKIPWAIDAGVLAVLLPFLNAWNSKWAISKNKSSASATDRKNTNFAKKALTAAMRPFVQTWIYRNDAMDDADIISCGLNPHDKTRVRNTKPDTEPYLQHKVLGTHVLGIYYRQGAAQPGVNNRGKPPGVGYAKIAYFIGDNPPSSPADFPKVVMATRSPLKLTFAPADAGKKITLFACWVTPTFLEGNWNEGLDGMVP